MMIPDNSPARVRAPFLLCIQALALVLLFFGCNGSEGKPVVFPPDGVRLQYRPGSPRPQAVFVSGSFNEWKMFDPAFRMVWDAPRKVFSINFSLPAGEYMYKFIVDGEWVVDPRADRVVEDKLGGGMGVFVVRQGTTPGASGQ